jgi:hypothetical protein
MGCMALIPQQVIRQPLKAAVSDKPPEQLLVGMSRTSENDPKLFGLAIQDAIYAGKDTIDPSWAFRLAMESAISMSKVDLASS